MSTPSHRRRRAGAAVCMAVVVAATVSAGCAAVDPVHPKTTEAAQTSAPGRVTDGRVVRVVDGDTLIATVDRGRRITIRLTGIDTPETVKPHVAVGCYGPQASALAKKLATPGAPIVVESDPVVGNTDKYGRTLGYVYLADDSMLNERLLQAGAAREYDFDGQSYRYRDRFLTEQDTARAHRAGLWGQCP